MKYVIKIFLFLLISLAVACGSDADETVQKNPPPAIDNGGDQDEDGNTDDDDNTGGDNDDNGGGGDNDGGDDDDDNGDDDLDAWPVVDETDGITKYFYVDGVKHSLMNAKIFVIFSSTNGEGENVQVGKTLAITDGKLASGYGQNFSDYTEATYLLVISFISKKNDVLKDGDYYQRWRFASYDGSFPMANFTATFGGEEYTTPVGNNLVDEPYEAFNVVGGYDRFKNITIDAKIHANEYKTGPKVVFKFNAIIGSTPT
jgi:hypothetical protein